MVFKLIYHPITLYLKDEQLRIRLKKAIVEYENANEAVKAILDVYDKRDIPKFA